MVIAALPDIKGAIIAHLRGSAEITALAQARISGRLQDAWTMPTYAVLIQGPRGGPGEQAGALAAHRFDIRCYGPDERTANLLWRTVDAYLLVPDGSRAVSFVAAHTRVYEVASEGGPIELIDPDTLWPSNDGSYIFTYSAAPAP